MLYDNLRAISHYEYIDILAEYPDECFNEYPLNYEEGVFEGTIKLKKWGRKRNIICFVECKDGIKFKWAL